MKTEIFLIACSQELNNENWELYFYGREEIVPKTILKFYKNYFPDNLEIGEIDIRIFKIEFEEAKKLKGFLFYTMYLNELDLEKKIEFNSIFRSPFLELLRRTQQQPKNQ